MYIKAISKTPGAIVWQGVAELRGSLNLICYFRIELESKYKLRFCFYNVAPALRKARDTIQSAGGDWDDVFDDGDDVPIIF